MAHNHASNSSLVDSTFSKINPILHHYTLCHLNPICHLLALAGAHHFVHVSRLRVNIDVRVILRSVSELSNDPLINFSHISYSTHLLNWVPSIVINWFVLMVFG